MLLDHYLKIDEYGNKKPRMKKVTREDIYVNGEKATGKYLKEILSLVNRDFSGNGYYTQMAAGWLLAECFVTFPARIWEFLADKEHLRLDNVSYRKAVNKICESLTPDKEVKAMVRRL